MAAPERAAVDFGQPEERVVAGHDHVGIPDQADATAHAEAVHGGDHGYRAVVDGGEGGETPLVGPDERPEALGVLHLLDVDPGVEATALGAQHDDTDERIAAGFGDDPGELEPAVDGERIDRWDVDDDLGDALVVDVRGDAHGCGSLLGF